jgi:molybdopterin converting factor small subunit
MIKVLYYLNLRRKKMKKEEFLKLKKRLTEKANEVMRKKEKEYLSEDDIILNFRKIAKFRSKETPCMIMDLMSKQLVSISDMVNTMGYEDYTKDQWDEKFVDVLNYTFKLYASIMEV